MTVTLLGKRTIQTSGNDILVELIATGNGQALKIDDCPLIPLSMEDTYRVLNKFSHAKPESGEGITEIGEKMLVVLVELY